MIVRALDANGDWTFGASLNNYLKNQKAIIQNLNTRLNEWFGDCFFNTTAGVNWANLIGGKDQVAINLAITTVIINTDQVLRLTQLSSNLSATRELTVTYSVNTTYGQQNGLVTISPNI